MLLGWLEQLVYIVLLVFVETFVILPGFFFVFVLFCSALLVVTSTACGDADDIDGYDAIDDDDDDDDEIDYVIFNFYLFFSYYFCFCWL